MTPKEKADNISLIVQLTLAKLQILGMKQKNQGYDWWHLTDEGREQLDQALIEIDELLRELRSNKN